ncbi:CaiB/BaiF CoA transferase family protein [Halomonas alkalisoli]|uniref:CaiB/BaiF CoA transferase family protein n=1 Tax=Halomonas alkalisoli TaxID=2907158 RepID=UPI001F237007|nr:CaiB/BaiF CoA-transferase family protein [Halomonas alkalisoli]MCE9683455.1 CoA transferase [Halomonas alkalisoli]
MIEKPSFQRPLEGITIVSLEHAIAAPFCTRQLADLGARIIKVERPGVGDFSRGYDKRVNGLSSHFVWTNRSKESLTLNLKSPEGREILHNLLRESDALVQNLAPGAAERIGLSFEELNKYFSKLIVCNISGFGEGGPYQEKKAYDLLIQSEGGFLSVTGTAEEGGMAKSGVSIADISAGMYAYSSILSALLLRERTGEGSKIDISMFESLVEWMGYPMYYSYQGAEPPSRAGASHATIYPYGPFTAGDGRSVMLGLQNEREWKVFCERILMQPELVQDARFSTNFSRSANRDALRDLIHQAFSHLSADEVIVRLDEAQIANANVNDMHGVWKHPQLEARQRWTTVQSPAGELPTLLPPGNNSSYTAQIKAVPSLGQHNTTILSGLGYSDHDIQRFQDIGAI